MAAIQLLEHALKLPEAESQGLALLLRQYRDAGEPDAALQYMVGLAKSGESKDTWLSPDVALELGFAISRMLYFSLKAYADRFRRAFPTAPQPDYLLAWHFMGFRRYRRALARAKACAAIDPAYPGVGRLVAAASAMNHRARVSGDASEVLAKPRRRR